MSEFVRWDVSDGVGTIRLDRPKMNAISLQVQDELAAVAAEREADRHDLPSLDRVHHRWVVDRAGEGGQRPDDPVGRGRGRAVARPVGRRHGEGMRTDRPGRQGGAVSEQDGEWTLTFTK